MNVIREVGLGAGAEAVQRWVVSRQSTIHLIPDLTDVQSDTLTLGFPAPAASVALMQQSGTLP